MDIKCIFYSEFDLKAGPVILYQHPPDYIQQETFKVLQSYVIPSK